MKAMPLVYHPNTLLDPELGPIVQKQLADGTAVLSAPACLDCAQAKDERDALAAKLAALEREIAEAPVVSGWKNRHGEWVCGSETLIMNPTMDTHRARLVRIEPIER